MSTRRKFERQMARSGARAMAGPTTAGEMFEEANALVAVTLPVLVKKQPMNPMAQLLALDCMRNHIELVIDESPVTDADKAKLRESYRHARDIYEESLRARGQSSREIRNVYGKNFDRGHVRVEIVAYRDRLPTEADASLILREQAGALREMADMIEQANAEDQAAHRGAQN